MPTVLFLKAKVKGDTHTPDLFATPVQVAGHMRGGAFVAPYTATRTKAADTPPAAAPAMVFTGTGTRGRWQARVDAATPGHAEAVKRALLAAKLASQMQQHPADPRRLVANMAQGDLSAFMAAAQAAHAAYQPPAPVPEPPVAPAPLPPLTDADLDRRLERQRARRDPDGIEQAAADRWLDAPDAEYQAELVRRIQAAAATDAPAFHGTRLRAGYITDPSRVALRGGKAVMRDRGQWVLIGGVGGEAHVLARSVGLPSTDQRNAHAARQPAALAAAEAQRQHEEAEEAAAAARWEVATAAAASTLPDPSVLTAQHLPGLLAGITDEERLRAMADRIEDARPDLRRTLIAAMAAEVGRRMDEGRWNHP